MDDQRLRERWKGAPFDTPSMSHTLVRARRSGTRARLGAWCGLLVASIVVAVEASGWVMEEAYRLSGLALALTLFAYAALWLRLVLLRLREEREALVAVPSNSLKTLLHARRRELSLLTGPASRVLLGFFVALVSVCLAVDGWLAQGTHPGTGYFFALLVLGFFVAMVAIFAMGNRRTRRLRAELTSLEELLLEMRPAEES